MKMMQENKFGPAPTDEEVHISEYEHNSCSYTDEVSDWRIIVFIIFSMD